MLLSAVVAARWLPVLCLVAILAPARVQGQDSARAELILLDVGQADAVVVRSPEGKAALIDAGRAGMAHLLAALGIDTIDVAIASHPHADHIGGMEQVLRTFPVRYYMDNGAPHTTATYRSLMAQLERSDVVYLEATARTITLGSVTLRILPPPTEGDHNNRSVGVLVEFGDFKAILTGDSEWPELEHFLGLGVPEVTVLKAAHHGSYNGVTPAWLAATGPEIVVISVGAGNSYGHPHPQALNLYQAAATVYRTDVHGTVVIRGAKDGTVEVVTQTALTAEAGGRTPDSLDTVADRPSPSLTLSVFPDAPGNDHYNLNGEYVILRNTTSVSVAIGRWTLCDLARHCYTFPEAAAIAPGDSAIVYTGPGQDDGRNFYMHFRQAVWNNDGDVAVLVDRTGRVVARYAY